MFAHAMISTRPVTPNSSMSGAPALPSMTWLCPRAPGATTIFFARKRAIVWSLMPFCSGASTSLRIAWYGTFSAARGLVDRRDAGLQAREEVDPVVAPVVEAVKPGAHELRAS